MFKTMIGEKEVKVTFSHQKAAHVGQLTRPEIKRVKLLRGLAHTNIVVRVSVFAVTHCFFDEECVGVAFCSYSDQHRWSKETGRVVALKNALVTKLKRTGKNDTEVAAQRRRVWYDYYSTKGRLQFEAELIESLKRIRDKWMEQQEPLPLDAESVPWELGGQRSAMDDEVQAFLNDESRKAQGERQ